MCVSLSDGAIGVTPKHGWKPRMVGTLPVVKGVPNRDEVM